MRNFPIARRCITFFRWVRAVPHAVLLKISPARDVIEKDIVRFLQECSYSEEEKLPVWRSLIFLVGEHPEFRNLLYYRVEMSPHLPSRLLLSVARFLFKPMSTLFIFTPVIGPGLYIQHGFSTVIAANSIGRNCWINQQVTIGYLNKTDCPTIGDNVRIAAGAKVFGDIIVGNSVIIGANAVVCKSVPSNCTVVGVPAYIVRRNGKKVREAL